MDEFGVVRGSRIEGDFGGAGDGGVTLAPTSQHELAGDGGQIVVTEDVDVKKKESGWIKFLRVVIWAIAVIALTVGTSLIAMSGMAGPYVDGSYAAKDWWGWLLFWLGFGVGMGNFVWGIVRWFLRWRREKWKVGKVVGKVIGGGIWRFFVVMPVMAVALFWIVPMIGGQIVADAVAKNEERAVNSVMKIEGAFLKGEITTDEYVTYLADAAYRAEILPENYRDNKTILMPDILGIVEENLENLSRETVEYALGAMMLTNVEFGTDASGNVTSGMEHWFFGDSAYAKTSDVTTLNKAKLSENGNFLIFYTNVGADKVDDGGAEVVGAMLEEIVSNYRDRLGFEYAYKKIKYKGKDDFFGKTAEEKMRDVLESNGVDVKYLNEAMFVYLANPYKSETNVLATYAGERFADTLERIGLSLGGLFGDETSKFYNSSLVLPFINILPNNIGKQDLTLVVAHELGHHYASNYCYGNFGKKCSDADFIDETIANYAAINVVNDQPRGSEINTIGYHHELYIKYGTCYSIPNIVSEPPKLNACHKIGSYEGYPTVAFLQNYAEVVKNGDQKIWGALAEEDAWGYLYEQAGENQLRETMVQLAQRNLTNDYGTKYSLFADVIPSGEEISCYDFCANTYSSRYATTQYFYFPVGEFDGKMIEARALKTDGRIAVSVLGKRLGNWGVIDSSYPGLKYTIEDVNGYDVVAIAVTNYAEGGEGQYSLKISDTELDELIEDEVVVDGEYEFDWIGYKGNCFWVEFDGLFGAVGKIMDVFGEIDGAKIDEGLESLEKDKNEMEKLGVKKMTVCQTMLKRSKSHAELKTILNETVVRGSWNLLNLKDETVGEMSVFVNYRAFSQSLRVYALWTYGEDSLLYTVTAE